MSKRQKICIDFLKTFDEFGHLTHDAFSDDYIDVEIRERMVVSIQLPFMDSLCFKEDYETGA